MQAHEKLLRCRSWKKLKTKEKKYKVGKHQKATVDAYISRCHVSIASMLKMVLFGPSLEKIDRNAIVYDTKNKVYVNIDSARVLDSIFTIADLHAFNFVKRIDDEDCRLMGCGKLHFYLEMNKKQVASSRRQKKTPC